jgi:hypothetical protein
LLNRAQQRLAGIPDVSTEGDMAVGHEMVAGKEKASAEG